MELRNKELDGLTPFIVMEVLERAQVLEREGREIIHLEVGEPDFDVPSCVEGATIASLKKGETHYTHSLGSLELREAISDMYSREYGVDVSPGRIIVTSGSSPAILMALLALGKRGDEVLLSDPGYPCYKNFVLTCGLRPVTVSLSPENQFRYEAKKFAEKITSSTAAIFINSPMNPTGVVMQETEFREIAALGVPVISDEIYHGLIYGERPHTMLEYDADAFVINGFSKRFAMTGLRLGYIIVPDAYVRILQILQQNLFICAPSTAQAAGVSVLKNGIERAKEMNEVYNERRMFMINRLQQMGFVLHALPKGAFYVYADASAFTNDSYNFAFEILENTGVGVTPGIDFGASGKKYIRFSYANSIEKIRVGLDRIETYLKKRVK